MPNRYLLAVVILLAQVQIQAQTDQQETTAIPPWVAEHMAFLSQGTGCWQTSNSEYQSEAEPFDSYYNQWDAGIGGELHLQGRLYGQTGSRPSDDFWSFVSYWDGQRNQAVTLQFGRNGIVGDGTMWKTDDHQFVQEQVFSMPDGRTWKTRHNLQETADSFITTSLDWQDDQWQQRRSYTWHRCQSPAG